ncbi:autotransporter outer membrane beta-barrel domain-containing protein [Bradyrhizobium sp. 195]|uniref:autotransporter outer membrane beta-barrel domain-containing protein n=1 Tax=Bradyrhizobium sp. 195 TaxID=2782662 RepID=UPI0020010FB9|nr:autotransporter outer membrane beta-barrel domain-containing protein [Bradyrhizobium sp. 195]UPK27715.1 autotransporter domain-containing protein [Bradyrhizobium sp. 195]
MWIGISGNGNSGAWGTATNWSPNTVPNAVGAEAVFSGTPPAGAYAVDLGNNTYTIGTLRLQSATRYVIANSAGAAGTINFQVAAGNALLAVTASNTQTPLFASSADTVGPVNINLSSSLDVNVAAGQFLRFGNATTITGAGDLNFIGAGTVQLDNANTYTGQTRLTAGTVVLENLNALGSGFVHFQGGTLRANVSGTLSEGFVVDSGGTAHIIASNGVTLNLGGAFSTAPNAAAIQFGESGNTGIIVWNNLPSAFNGPNVFTLDVLGGTLRAAPASSTLSNFASIAVATNVAAGATLDFGTGVKNVRNLQAAGTVNGDNGAINIGGGQSSGAITGATGLVAAAAGAFTSNTGILTLSGANTYTGATTVNGTLVVNGSIAASTLTTVNNGGTLTGTGTVGNTSINAGGRFAPGSGLPGSAMTVAGNLAFQSGALYLVQVDPSNASKANVTAGGAASLAGTVQASFAAGSYVTRSYTILSAAGGLGGTTFDGVTTSSLPTGFKASLGYAGNDVILNLIGQLGASGLNQNQQNVANGLNTYFNNGGALPPGFVSIYGLTGGNLANALSQLSGEAATGAQQSAFRFMGQFLGLMLDPFVDGRGGADGASNLALGLAPDRDALPEDIALAYAKVMKAPAYKASPPPGFEQRWTAWGAGFGGYNKTSGDPIVIGSHDLTASVAGVAAGLDYRLSRDAVIGFALSGGGTKWDLAQGLGGGKSDAFQAGVYGAVRSGPAYLAASLAFANHWMSTDRFAPFGDHLTASFNARSIGARLETGYRLGTPASAVTPYGALQAQGLRTPNYTETDLGGGGFGLTYDARSATDLRSELGARVDHLAVTGPSAVLTLRGRLAWAHDWVSDPSLTAVFQALPGASFVVNGAGPVKDSALASAGAELSFANGVSLLAKFDGEFANHGTSYAGTGTLRVNW